MTDVTYGSFSIGRVVERTFQTLKTNLVTFGVITVLLIVLPQIIRGALTLRIQASGGVTGILLLPVGLGVAFSALVAQAAMIIAAVSSLSGARPTVQACLRQGLPHWWRLFLVSLCSGFMIVLAAIALIVPGLMLYTRWAVALPVQVLEGLGVFASMGRSAVLTKGRRWSVFALVIVYLLAIWIIEAAVIGFSGGFTINLAQKMNTPVNLLLITPLIQLVIFPIGSVGMACIYYELTGGLTGSGAAKVAAVFD